MPRGARAGPARHRWCRRCRRSAGQACSPARRPTSRAASARIEGRRRRHEVAPKRRPKASSRCPSAWSNIDQNGPVVTADVTATAATGGRREPEHRVRSRPEPHRLADVQAVAHGADVGCRLDNRRTARRCRDPERRRNCGGARAWRMWLRTREPKPAARPDANGSADPAPGAEPAAARRSAAATDRADRRDESDSPIPTIPGADKAGAGPVRAPADDARGAGQVRPGADRDNGLRPADVRGRAICAWAQGPPGNVVAPWSPSRPRNPQAGDFTFPMEFTLDPTAPGS